MATEFQADKNANPMTNESDKETMEQQTNTSQQAPQEHTAPAVDEQAEGDQVMNPQAAPETDPEAEPDAGQDPEDIGDGDQLKKANREAANYRHQLREAQAEIEQLKTAAETGLQQAFSARASEFTKIQLDAQESRQFQEQIGATHRLEGAEIKLKHPEDFERLTGLTPHDLTYEGTSVFDESRYTKELEKLFRKRPELFEGTEDQYGQLRAMKAVAGAFRGSPVVERSKSWRDAFGPSGDHQ